MFAYHMRYRLVEIERTAGRKATRDRDGLAGIPNLISVVASDGTQYDFCGVDDNNLVRISLDVAELEDVLDERNALDEDVDTLQSTLDSLRSALVPFILFARAYLERLELEGNVIRDDKPVYSFNDVELTVGDFRRLLEGTQ